MKTYQDFLYEEVTLTVNITITIKKYEGSEAHLNIPSHIQGFPVTILGHSAFSDCSHLESVILPKTLLTIEDNVFSYCKKLQSIQFPSSLNSIGKQAFQHCTSLEELILPEGLNTLNNECFSNCTRLKRVYFPKSLRGMGEKSFLDCIELEEVSTHSDFVFRDRDHFSGCKKLWNHQGLVVINGSYLGYYGDAEALDIPEGITQIPPFLCADRKNLLHLTLPSTLERIEECAFQGCEALSQVDFPKKIKKLPYLCFQNCISLKRVVLPEALEEIDSSCFRGCIKLEEILWNDALHTIGEHAFHRTWISVLPALPSLKHIERRAFADCKNLKEVHFSPTLLTLGDGAFHLSLSLEAVMFQHSEEVTDKIVSQRKNLFSYNQNMKKAPPSVVATWADSHQTSFRLHQFLHWETLDLEHQSYFYENWSDNTEGNLLVDMIFLEGFAKEMSFFIQLGFPLTLSQVDDYLSHQIYRKKTAETAVLLDYKKRHFTLEETQSFETNKDLLDMGLILPTLSQLQKKWKCLVDKNAIHLQSYIGTKEEEYLPDFTSEGMPIVYAKYYILESSENFCSLARIIFSTGEEIDLFSGSTTLKTLEFPPDVAFIEHSAYENMAYLQEVILPDKLMAINSSAFSNCPNLTTIFCNHISEHCFETVVRNCTSLDFIGPKDGVNFLDIMH